MKEALQQIMPLDKAEKILSIGQARSMNAHEYYLRAGEVPKSFAFVLSGLFRYVYINEKGDEFTKGLIMERDFISSYSAMESQSPSHFFIEAMEDAEILNIPHQKWLVLLETDVFWLKFLLKSIEKGFSKKEKRERDLLLLNAETRYLDFLGEYPGIEKRISQAIIASYLGIKPESLSRIRKNLPT
ncbi:MAG: Crp/Fnr family transcriptional regulator [Muricauda sp.]|jgi:CRP-like cAMP-binding protein|nr:Crp/Fnr family transcriptional regulator [Allomuricauda sp.]